MKAHLAVAALTFALCAGQAQAQGTFNPGGRQAAKPASPGLAEAYKSAPAPKPPTPPSPPPADGFKPHEPFKGASVYGAPKPATPGAKPCQTSVYVNACPKQP